VAGPWAVIAIAWAYVLVVGLSNTLPMQVGVARVLYAMGRDRQLPHALAQIHPRYHTPHVSMIVTATISLTVALAMRDQLDNLAIIVNFGALSGILFMQVSVIVFFGIHLKSDAWFTHWLAPLIGIAVVLAVLSGMSALAIKAPR
jgi:amino acid transporter